MNLCPQLSSQILLHKCYYTNSANFCETVINNLQWTLGW
jgi:hypothetical protein